MGGVTVKELGLHFVRICLEQYWGSCVFLALFTAGLFWSLTGFVRERMGASRREEPRGEGLHGSTVRRDALREGAPHGSSSRREGCFEGGRGRTPGRPDAVFLSMAVFLLLTVYNPLLVKYVIPALHFEKEYYRFFWMLPVVPGTAFYVVKLIFAVRSGWGKALLAAGTAAVLAVLGTPLAGIVLDFQMAENIYKVPEDLILACGVIHEDTEKENPRVVFDIGLNTAARQYDPSLHLVLNRDAVLYRAGSPVVSVNAESLSYRRQKVIMDKLYYGESIKPERLKNALVKTKTDYLVLPEEACDEEYMEKAGCRLAGMAGERAVYRFLWEQAAKER